MDAKAFHLALIDALLDLHRKQGAGVLRAEAGTLKKQIIVRAGRLAFAESNQPEEHLARILIGMRLVQRADLTRISAAMKEGKPSDEAILATCKLTAEDVAGGAREHALVVVTSLLARNDYRLHCYPGDAFPQRSNSLNLALPEIIVEAARRAAASGNLPEPIKSPKGKISRIDLDGSARSELPLDRIECYACSLVPEPSNIEDLLPVLAAADPKPVPVIQRLLLLGFLEQESLAAAVVKEAPQIDPAELEMEELLGRFETAGHYEILSVPPNATPDQIKDSYHELARRHHPDRYASEKYRSLHEKAEKLFTYITGAYAVLGDASARAAYDVARTKPQAPRAGASASDKTGAPDKAKMAEALSKAGRIHLAQQEFEKAITKFKECLWLEPGEAKHHHYLGVAQAEVTRYRKEAEQHLLKAVEMNPTSVESRMALGKLYLKVNLSRRAHVQFQEVLRWDPGHPEALKLSVQADASGTGG